ncbi:hypothetical protein GCM10023336_38780 [Streptomyces similanensis]|uniref:Uncharacterized protein n=1 Tax=Streptomyces similanensis TaxID=1274988 RepID=A0ABP9KRD8_9ACTN
MWRRAVSRRYGRRRTVGPLGAQSAPRADPTRRAPREEQWNTCVGPPVTPQKPALYQPKGFRGAPFCQVRSHWGSRVTTDTENNPLIGLPNQHIVGLTYVP